MIFFRKKSLFWVSVFFDEQKKTEILMADERLDFFQRPRFGVGKIIKS
jgi:hypothetical protein